ncbi:glycosyltransferase family 2 protein [Flagellimonas zhangzhouensis]|uniref:glycosyltransferase family 2 protein n=1 Tax=Flagellimonas zhangzhouensis TaxID=1073328 RepID=UPI0021CDE126|nr:glycosyltransferase family 2 protein [Allomuricauda zhangzhouensis]
MVNYNNWQDTIECLESVLKSKYSPIDIVVVDNSPSFDSIKNLESWAEGNVKVERTNFSSLVFPENNKPLKYLSISDTEYWQKSQNDDYDVIFVKAGKNEGFAAANNVVLKTKLDRSGQEELLFLLNNDTVIPPDLITKLASKYVEHDYGVVGCVLLEYSKPDIVQSVGGLYNKYFGITTQALEGIKINELGLEKAHIDYPVGAAMFLSIKVLKQIGLLEEKYFLYYEELDWVQRGKVTYSTTYFEDCFVYHKGGVSIGSNHKSFIADKYSLINRINFAKKYNRTYLTTTYLGVFFSIFKRFLFLKFKRGASLFYEVLKINPNKF